MNVSQASVVGRVANGKEYGGFTNRVEHDWESCKNRTKFTIKGTLAGGTTLGLGILAAKNKGVATAFAKVPELLAKGLAKILPRANGLVNKLQKLPAKYKAIGTIAALGVGLFDILVHKHVYKQGQIDQKYKDKATVAKSFDIIK